jgi:GT2 family glycosyltransferase
MLDIAVLITVHNRKDQTLACLERVFNQKGLGSNFSLTVYLVDDASTDGTELAIREKFKNVVIIKGDGNQYWNRGMNLAWTTAAQYQNYNHFLWLNDDTLLYEDSISTLLKTSLELNDESIVVGTTFSTKRAGLPTYGGRDKQEKVVEPGASPHPCFYFNGNIVLIPEHVFLKTGFNDPIFHHSLGDYDYGLRAAKNGIKAYVSPGRLGLCESHDHLPAWCNPETSLRNRWSIFRTPLGQNPEEFFRYNVRHWGISKAIKHYVTNHLRMLFPSIWIRKSNVS